LTQWQGEQDTLTPVDLDEAILLYEGPLSEHAVSYHEAFPDVTAVDLDAWLGAQLTGTPAAAVFEGPVISVADGRATVGRWQPDPTGGASFQAARNWHELEARAAEAVEDAGGAQNLSGLYSCPADLAARAIWPHDPPTDPQALTVGRVADFLGYSERQVRGLLAETNADRAGDPLAEDPHEPLDRATITDMIATRAGGTRTASKLAQLLSETR
jgi:hypothetical protein